MNRTRDVAIAAAAAVAVCLLLFPPFMVIDPAAADVRHAPLGHHPFWRPPTPDLAARALAGIPGPASQDGGLALTIGINRVRLVLELGAVALGALVVLAVPRWRQQRTR